MLVVMRRDATEEEIDRVCRVIRDMGLTPHPIPGAQRVAIGVTGNKEQVNSDVLMSLPGVLEIIHVTKPYKLTGREMKPEDTVVQIGTVAVGGPELTIIAGPCAVESYEQTMTIARAVRSAGAHLLRGGAYKPRTSPYTFQGLGREGLEILHEARAQTGLPIVTEAVDVETFDLVEEVADVIQIGARNMQNFSLLKRAGQSRKPILLKRGFGATVEEFLLAAEYILAGGNYNVILCERGIRTFNTYSRFTLDITVIPELKRITHLPVIVDPSHAAGRREFVIPLARAAVAVGADGIMIDVHPEPTHALVDGAQALTPGMFHELVAQIRQILPAVRPQHTGVVV